MATGIQPGELRELSDKELETKLLDKKEELFNLRVRAATGQLENNHLLKGVRKEIARIYTIMNERKLGLSAAPEESNE
ncbi:50S ribosomal protein L29 [Natronoglycomyces albus]|uniref:Large ribosomal subunit protein uL29 n=1 Tax=Natronoglycomyces albus TaxID=2811108 RepID=A0A895XLV9_9ACTN|nr:50S ribosomal protein L29 [Natronoglycomyces albus]